MTALTISPVRIEALRNALQSSIASLHRRQASDIPEDFIEDYVRLNWLEWCGGGLKLTTTGENICRQLATSAREAEPESLPEADSQPAPKRLGRA